MQAVCEAAGVMLPSYRDSDSYRVICPKCLGGSNKEPSLAVTVSTKQGRRSVWVKCFRATCDGFKGFLPERAGKVYTLACHPAHCICV